MRFLNHNSPSPPMSVPPKDGLPPARSFVDPEKAPSADKLEGAPIGTHLVSIDPEEEKRVVRKLDWHVPPLVSFLCTCGGCCF